MMLVFYIANQWRWIFSFCLRLMLQYTCAPVLLMRQLRCKGTTWIHLMLKGPSNKLNPDTRGVQKVPGPTMKEHRYKGYSMYEDEHLSRFDFSPLISLLFWHTLLEVAYLKTLKNLTGRRWHKPSSPLLSLTNWQRSCFFTCKRNSKIDFVVWWSGLSPEKLRVTTSGKSICFEFLDLKKKKKWIVLPLLHASNIHYFK